MHSALERKEVVTPAIAQMELEGKADTGHHVV
jgi:hypothetical protein